MALPELDLDPAAPLAAASKRLHDAQAVQAAAKRPVKPSKDNIPPVPKPRGRTPTKVPPDLVLGLTAAGVSQNKIAKALHANRRSVYEALEKIPNSRERVSELREALKGVKMERAHRVEAKMWQRLEDEVDSGDAKSVDAMARALLASEKIQAAASGEAHASGSAAPPVTNQDLAGLIQILIAAPA